MNDHNPVECSLVASIWQFGIGNTPLQAQNGGGCGKGCCAGDGNWVDCIATAGQSGDSQVGFVCSSVERDNDEL